jgi:hypothetical protein
LTITASNQSKVYGATAILGTTGFTETGLVNSDTITGVTLTSSGSVATATVAGGPYAIAPSAALGAGLSNYTISYANAPIGLTVASATLTITANNAVMTYGDSSLPTLSVSYSGFANGDNASSLATAANAATSATAYNGTAGSASNAGNYAIVASGAAMANYAISYAPGTLTVNKANVTLVANDSSKFVATADPAGFAGVSAVGLVNGDAVGSLGAVTVSRTNAAVNVAGVNANVLQPAGASSANYNISTVNGAFTIAPALQLVVDLGATSGVYGSAPTYSVVSAKYINSGGSLVALANLTVSGSQISVSDGVGGAATFNVQLTHTVASTSGNAAVGVYPLGYANSAITGANFNTLVVTGSDQVLPKAVPFSASGLTKTYDGSVAMTNLTLGLGGAVTADQVALSGTGVYAASNASSNIGYTLSGLALSGADAGDYMLFAPSMAGSSGVITQKTVTLSAAKIYDGSTSLNGAVTIGGLIGGQTLTYRGAVAQSANVGAGNAIAAITLQNGSGLASNYQAPTLNAANAPVSVSPEALVIAATPNTKPYDRTTSAAAAPTLVSGVLYDSATLSETYTSVNAGSGLTLTPSTTIVNAGNYTVTYLANSAGVINQATLTVSGETAANKVYDATTVATLSGGVLLGVVAGDSVTLTQAGAFVSANAAANVGIAANDAISGASTANYALVQPTGLSAAIAQEPVTVTAAANSKTYDGGVLASALPVVTSGTFYGGAALSETYASPNAGSSLTLTPTANAVNAANYAVAYVNSANGVITPATLTVTANNAAKTYDGLVYSGGNGVSYSGFVNSETASVFSGALAYGGTAQGAVNAGAYSLTASGLTSGNYAISYASGALSIAARLLTVTAAAQSRVYGDANPGLTYAVGGAGLVQSDTLNGQLRVVATQTSGVGAFAIGQGSLSASNNYALTYIGANLTVTPRPIVVAAQNMSRPSGQSNPILLYAIGGDGLVNGDSPYGQLATPANLAARAGAYPILAGSLSAGPNYAMTFIGADLTVTSSIANSNQNPERYSEVLATPTTGALNTTDENCKPESVSVQINQKGYVSFQDAAGALCRR